MFSLKVQFNFLQLVVLLLKTCNAYITFSCIYSYNYGKTVESCSTKRPWGFELVKNLLVITYATKFCQPKRPRAYRILCKTFPINLTVVFQRVWPVSFVRESPNGVQFFYFLRWVIEMFFNKAESFLGQ